MLTDSQQVAVAVLDTNVAPVLAAISNQTITETNTLTFTASATDSDLPQQTLSYSLSGAPSGANINSGSGDFSWTPTEAQGPGVYTFTVIASDNGTPVMTDSQQIVVTVNELNQAPVLATINNQTILETNTLSFTLTATDGDIPANGLTYSVVNNPPGATLDNNSGLFSWTPSKAQGPGVYTLTFKVSDDGVPVLTDSQTITITVADTPPSLVLTKTVAVATSPVTPGEAVTYTLVLSNSGGATTDITLSDVLPVGVSGTNLDQIVNIGAETSLTLIVVATATADAGYGVVITNTASFSHTSGSGSDTASFSIIADTTPPDVSAVSLITPTNNVQLGARRPSFSWTGASDSQSGVVSYTLILTGNGTTRTFTSPVTSYTPLIGLDLGSYSWSIRAHDASGNVSPIAQPPANFVIEQRITTLYLPLAVKDYAVAPDLVIDSLITGSGGVTITLRNAGDQAVTEAFWVDAYFNPSQVPSLNQPWNTIAPAGAVWGVTKSLAPGESLSLTVGDSYYFAADSSPTFPAGATMYAYADSINHTTVYGNIWESNEANNVAGPVVSTAVGEGVVVSTAGSVPAGLPGRGSAPVIESDYQLFLPIVVKN